MTEHHPAFRPAGGREASPGPQGPASYQDHLPPSLQPAYSNRPSSSHSTANPGPRYPSSAYPQETISQQSQPAMPETFARPPGSRQSSASHHQLVTSISPPPPVPGAVPRSPLQSPAQPARRMPFTPPPGASGSSSRPSSSHTNATHRQTQHATQQHSSTGFTPSIRGHSRTPMHLLLINPNSSSSITNAYLTAIRNTLPSHIEVTGYTAPQPAPSAIESYTDAILSTEACLRDLAKYSAANHETVRNYDGMLVASFSKHPLVEALRETYDVPVVGIMESAIYVARMLGGRFGIVATSPRSKILHDDAVLAFGLSHFYVGAEPTQLIAAEVDSKSRDEALKAMSHASKTLAGRGADVILLDSAGMSDLVRAAKDAVREDDGRRMVNVIDGVEAGIMVLSGLVGMGVPTSKKGLFASAELGRKNRGQTWT